MRTRRTSLKRKIYLPDYQVPPDCLISSALLGKTARVILRSVARDCEFITKLNEKDIWRSVLDGRPSGGRPSGGRPSGGRPSGGRPSGGKANDRSGAGRERKSDFKTIEQKHLTQGETA